MVGGGVKKGRPTRAEEMDLSADDILTTYENSSTIKEAAATLGISEKTMRTYLKKVPRKQTKRKRKRTPLEKKREKVRRLLSKKSFFKDVRGRKIPTAAIAKSWITICDDTNSVLIKARLKDSTEVHALFNLRDREGTQASPSPKDKTSEDHPSSETTKE